MKLTLEETFSLNLINLYLKKKDKKSIVFWTGGKDSTLLLYLMRLSPHWRKDIPVVFLDSQDEFPEIYHFTNKLKKKWELNLIREKYSAPSAKKSRENKIKALKKAVKKLEPDYAFIAIRWDEHKAREKENYVSKRKNHTRVHPVLHFTEEQVWDSIRELEIPYCKLYDQGYRSLGVKSFTHKAEDSERSGREMDKEKIMERLRELGYF